MNKHRTIEAMRQHGGSFVRALAEAWLRGDELNRQKIEAAWRETWLRYEAMAERMEEKAHD